MKTATMPVLYIHESYLNMRSLMGPMGPVIRGSMVTTKKMLSTFKFMMDLINWGAVSHQGS